MAIKSSNAQYGSVAVFLHWLSAALVLALVATGLKAGGSEDAAAKVDLLQVHIPLGIAIGLLTLTRIAWWVFADKKPIAVPMPSWQDRLSRMVHFLFYVVILGMAASGIGLILLSGAGPAIFGGDAAKLVDFWNYPPRFPHGIGARILIALFVLHAGAALYHHVFTKDDALRRMWFNK